MASVEHTDREAVSEVANAMQEAVLAIVELEASARERRDQVDTVKRALTRAVMALRRLQLPQTDATVQ